VLKSNSDPKDS